jgi:hypothetical protein
MNSQKNLDAKDSYDKSKIECTFFKQGKCNKGKDCEYKHSSVPSIIPNSIQPNKNNQDSSKLVIQPRSKNIVIDKKK